MYTASIQNKLYILGQFFPFLLTIFYSGLFYGYFRGKMWKYTANILRLQTKNKKNHPKIGLKNVYLIEKMCTVTMMEFCHIIKIWGKKGVPLRWIFAWAFGVAVGCRSCGWLAMTLVANISNIICPPPPPKWALIRYVKMGLFLSDTLLWLWVSTITLWYWYQSVSAKILPILRSKNIFQA